MNATLRIAVLGVAGLVIVGLGLPATAGAHPTDVAADPVSTVGHALDHWGWHNDWGTHQHGDHWTDHPHHDGVAGEGHHGPHGSHGPHAPDQVLAAL